MSCAYSGCKLEPSVLSTSTRKLYCPKHSEAVPLHQTSALFTPLSSKQVESLAEYAQILEKRLKDITGNPAESKRVSKCLREINRAIDQQAISLISRSSYTKTLLALKEEQLFTLQNLSEELNQLLYHRQERKLLEVVSEDLLSEVFNSIKPRTLIKLRKKHRCTHLDTLTIDKLCDLVAKKTKNALKAALVETNQERPNAYAVTQIHELCNQDFRNQNILSLNLAGPFCILSVHDAVKELTFSHSGKFLLIITYTNYFVVWDTTSEKVTARVGVTQCCLDRVYAVCSSQSLIAIAGTDGDVVIIDYVTEELTVIPTSEYCPIMAITFSRCGKFLLAYDLKNSLKQWRTSDWELENRWVNQPMRTNALQFSHCGQFLAGCFGGTLLCVLNLKKKSQLAQVDCAKDPVKIIAFAYSSSFIAVSTCQRNLWIKRTNSLADFKVFPQSADQIVSLQFSPNDEYLGSLQQSGVWTQYQVNTQDIVFEINTTFRIIRRVAISPCSTYLATHQEGQVTCFFAIKGSPENYAVEEHSSAVTTVAYCEALNMIVSGSIIGELIMWTEFRLRPIGKLHGHTNTVTSLVCFEQRVFSSSADGSIKEWDLRTKTLLRTILTSPVLSMVILPNLIVSSTKHGLQYRSHDSDTIIKTHYRVAAKLSVSPCFQYFAAIQDTTLEVYEIESDTVINSFGGVTAGIFTSDSKQVILGLSSGTIVVTDIDYQRLLGDEGMKGHRHYIRCLALSANGVVLASASEDLSIRVWNLEQEECLVTLAGARWGATALAFSSFAKNLISGSDDQRVQIWNIPVSRRFLEPRKEV